MPIKNVPELFAIYIEARGENIDVLDNQVAMPAGEMIFNNFIFNKICTIGIVYSYCMT